ncbi:hypothetical protein HDU98_011527, partial [Podochytrium sp. JEL0797]
TWTAVLHAFAKVGDMQGAENWLERMSTECVDREAISAEKDSAKISTDPAFGGYANALFDARVYNTMIGGYASSQNYDGAMRFLDEMREKGLRSDAITFGYCFLAFPSSSLTHKHATPNSMLIDSHLKRTPTHPDGDTHAALLTYIHMTKESITPNLHILTSLLTRLGHITGKLDAEGRPILARSGGGFSPSSRKLQPPAPPPPQLSPTTVDGTTRGKSIHHQNILYLYDFYRSLLQTIPDSSTPPLPIYDAVCAHFSTLHMVPQIKKTVYHCLVDGCVPDASLLVRAVKGVGRTSGWGGSVLFARDLDKIGSDLRRIKETNGGGSSGPGNDVGGSAVDALLMPAVSETIPRPTPPTRGLGKLVSGLLEGVNVRVAMHQWMGEEEHAEVMKHVNEAVLAAYPVFAFPPHDSEVDGDYNPLSCASILSYDPTTRTHFVAWDLKSDGGAMRLWDLVTRLQVERKGIQSMALAKGDFREWRLRFVRWCEMNGLWKARETCCGWVVGGEVVYKDGEYRRWLGSMK